MKKRITAVAALAAAVVLVVPAGALAHECYNPSRSDQGNEGAANSQRWLTIQTAEFFASAHEFLPVGPLSEAQIAEAVKLAQAQGIPTSFTIFVGSKTIGEGTPAALKHAADGKGIDHIFAAHGDALVAIVFAVAA